MQNIIAFLQKVLMINEVLPDSVGLSQFKVRPQKEEVIVPNKPKEVRISDLMRRN